MTTTYGTTVGFDAIAVALLGRTSPIGIVLAALLFGAMRTGASAMQIQAGVPADLVGVLQATILFFLVVSPVIKQIFRLRGAKTGLEERRPHSRRPTAGRRRSADGPVPVRHPGPRARLRAHRLLHRHPARHRPDHHEGVGADRVRGPVRRHVRTIRRRQHRHRGHDAGRRLRRLDGRRLPRPRARLRAVCRSSAPPRPSWSPWSWRSCPASSCRSSTPGYRSRSRRTRSSAARSSTSPRSGSPAISSRCCRRARPKAPASSRRGTRRT